MATEPNIEAPREMPDAIPHATQHPMDRLERTIGGIMRVGVVLSAVVLASGLVLLALGRPLGTRVLNVGLVLLMLIPASRILVSLVDAILRRDRLLVLATAVVSGIIVWQVLAKIL